MPLIQVEKNTISIYKIYLKNLILSSSQLGFIVIFNVQVVHYIGKRNNVPSGPPCYMEQHMQQVPLINKRDLNI